VDGVADCAVKRRALATHYFDGDPGEEQQGQRGGQETENGGSTVR
jgi:hypothetical protein